jgi:predicted nucleic acid-binding protein
MTPRRIFLDSNVLVAIGFRPDGDYARMLGFPQFRYVTSEHVLAEVSYNLTRLGKSPEKFIDSLRAMMEVTDQVTKLPAGLALHDDDDRQVLAEAIGAACQELVTFNSHDFKNLYGQSVYGVLIRHSGEFLRLHLSGGG